MEEAPGFSEIELRKECLPGIGDSQHKGMEEGDGRDTEFRRPVWLQFRGYYGMSLGSRT